MRAIITILSIIAMFVIFALAIALAGLGKLSGEQVVAMWAVEICLSLVVWTNRGEL